MTQTRRQTLAAGLSAFGMFCAPAFAAPRPYRVIASASEIRFLFSLNGIEQSGTAPLSSADLRIDPQNLDASTADVSADLNKARTGLIFATEAMKSAQVLNTRAFPTARFQSTRVRLGPGGRISDGARLDGNLSLRGQTHPIRFEAGIFRPKGSAPNDLSRLTVQLRGGFSRTRFGITGYPDLVADQVGLHIRAEIQAAA